MRSTLCLLALLLLWFTAACNRDTVRFIDSLIGEWEVVGFEAVGTSSGVITPNAVGGVLQLSDCQGATTFNPCPSTFTGTNGDVYELEWIAALDFDGVDRLELRFISDSNDFADDVIADVLNRPWNINLQDNTLQLNMAQVTQTGPALGFEQLAEAAVSLSKR
ncbi:MAG: hypothetical protein AAF597_03530 [Bacteroidota bacterium]